MDLWSIELNNYDKNNNKKNETIFALANGYRGLRGALEFSKLGSRGNIIAGVFDKAQAQVTEIVNCQDPLGFNIYIEDEIIDLEQCSIESFRRILDMRKGLVVTEIVVTTAKGKTIDIKSEKFVSRRNVHRWASKYEITAKNFSGKLFIENYIQGSVTNSSWDVMNRTKHLKVTKCTDINPGIAMEAKTSDLGIGIIECTTIINENNSFKTRKYSDFGEMVSEAYETMIKQGSKETIYKLGVTYTSRDTEKGLYSTALSEMNDFITAGYDGEKDMHCSAWNKIWHDIDIEIHGDDKAQRGIRFNLFQLVSSAYEGDTRVSIAAKALHGEGYKGHVFWDTEVFMLPFFIYAAPEVAKSLLMYRYNTLKGARKNAKLSGYKGARFPWEAADDGTEVTPKWGIDYEGNPLKICTGDEEFHINSDIVFGIIAYFRATGDKDFLKNCGVEILLDTAKFWQSRVEYNREKDRYEINSVIGPDEFHEHVNNNVFTNYLAKWNIEKALYYKEWLRKQDEQKLTSLCTSLCVSEKDFNQWKAIAEKMYIPTNNDGTIIEQFEGYFNLKHIEITEHDENSMPVWPKEAQLHRLGETQLIKQADVVQLMLMLPEEFSDEIKRANYEYYEKRTMHKSSLSPSMYSILGLSVGDRSNAYKYFMKTVYTDLEDNQGNTDFGLHGASTGGSWQSVIFGFAGVSVGKDGNLKLKPWIPEHFKKLKFKLNWQGSKLTIAIYQTYIEIGSTKDNALVINNKIYHVKENSNLLVKMQPEK